MIAQCLNGPVQAGDMVKVVLPSICCGSRTPVGRVFRVVAIDCSPSLCSICGHASRSVDVIDKIDSQGAWGTPVACVIRLDPPALPESIETVREVTA